MRIVHTSDWHLGRSFGEHSLLAEQARFLDWLVSVVTDEAIDLVVVAGDLFDRAVPSGDAVELFHNAMRRLLATGADVAAITGNHDSAQRLGSFEGLLTPQLILRGGQADAGRVDVRHYADGPLAIAAIPYLDPVLASPVDGRRPTHEVLLRRALDRARTEIEPGMRSIAIAHAFVTGAAPSDSERTIAVGDAAMVSASLFCDMSYVALGHLHRAQSVGDDTVRYSGAPLPYSFGETTQKEVVLVELDADGEARPKSLAVDVGRGVATLRGTIDELLAGRANDRDWVRVELTNTHPVADAHRRLRTHFPHLVEIARVARNRAEPDRLTVERIRQRSRTELAVDFLEAVAEGINPAEIELVQEAIADAQTRSS